MASQLVVSAVVALLLLLAGALMLVAGLRGRRIDDHPVCRRCRFDLAGVYPGAPACPECGAELAGTSAVRIGQRRRRRSALWTGTLALLLIPVVIGAGVAAAKASWTLYRVLPTPWLVSMVDPASPSGGEGALRELTRRAGIRLLAPDTFAALVELTLERQASADLPWSPAWGDPLAEAFSQGALTNEQLERYVKAAMSPTLVLRSPVASGEDQWPVGFGIPGARVGSRSYSHPTITAKLLSARVDGTSLDLPGRGPMTGIVYLHASHTSSVTHHLPLSVGPGRHPVRLEWLIEMQNVAAAARTFGPVITSWPLVLEGEVEVLPAGASVVQLVEDDSLRAQVAAMVVATGFTLDTQFGPATADGRITLRGEPTMPLAFDVFWRVGDREWRVGFISTRPGIGEAGAMLYGDLPGFDPATPSVDLILRPSPAAAVRDRTIDRIWDGEIVVRDVPLLPAPGSAPAPGGGD